MKSGLHNIPAVPVALGWTAGIMLWWAGVSWLWIAVGVAVGIVLMLCRLHIVALALYGVAGGWCMATLNVPQQAPEALLDGYENTYSAEVQSVTTSKDASSYVMRIDSILASDGHTKALTPFVAHISTLPEWMPHPVGTHLRFKAMLVRPVEAPQFEFDRDMRFYYLRHGIVASAYVNDFAMRVTGHTDSWRSRLDSWRSRIISVLAHSGLDENSYALAAAMIVGFDDDLHVDTLSSFRSAGVAHTLALSGFHVGIIALIISIVLFPLRLWHGGRNWRLVVTLALVWVYVAVVGMPDSACRAAMMYTAFVVGRLIGHNTNSYNSLAVAVLAILAVRPYSLFSVGFLLSVCAVLGIVVFHSKLNPIHPKHRTHYFAFQYLTVTAAATLGTLPVLLASIHTFAPLFLVTNVFMALLLPWFMGLGIISLICSMLGIKLLWLSYLTNHIGALMTDGVSILSSRVPVANVYLSDTQTALLTVAIILAAIALWTKHNNLRIVSVTMALACGALFPFAGLQHPVDEWFIMADGGNTPIVMRHGQYVAIVNTCSPARHINASQRVLSRLDHWIKARRISNVRFVTGNFMFGPYSRRADVLTLQGHRMALLYRPGKPEKLSTPSHSVLICPGYRGSRHKAIEATGSAQVILSPALSPLRARELSP